MTYIHLITGGQRSGKSSYAQSRALGQAEHPIYIATSRIWDKDHAERVERHKADRGKEWKNIEEEKAIGELPVDNETVVIDCITLWLTNFFFDENSDIEKCQNLAKEQLDLLKKKNVYAFIVTNEIGMGGHGENNLQRKFTDLQGRVNQYIASLADEVTLMVSGLPVKIK